MKTSMLALLTIGVLGTLNSVFAMEPEDASPIAFALVPEDQLLDTEELYYTVHREQYHLTKGYQDDSISWQYFTPARGNGEDDQGETFQNSTPLAMDKKYYIFKIDAAEQEANIIAFTTAWYNHQVYCPGLRNSKIWQLVDSKYKCFPNLCYIEKWIEGVLKIDTDKVKPWIEGGAIFYIADIYKKELRYKAINLLNNASLFPQVRLLFKNNWDLKKWDGSFQHSDEERDLFDGTKMTEWQTANKERMYGYMQDVLDEAVPMVASIIEETKTLYPTTHANVLQETPETIITTDNNNYASYQLETGRFRVAIGQEIQVSYSITVEKDGIISLGLLNTARNGWFGNEFVMKTGLHNGTCKWDVPSGETQASLVVRNYHLDSPGQTTFTLHRLEVERKIIEEGKFCLVKTGNSQAVNRVGQEITVTTDDNYYASYQLESNRFDVVMGQEIRISYKITVEEDGIMSLGLLNTARDDWYGKELVLKTGHYEDMYTRIVPYGETKTSLVFRNYHGILEGGPGQTTFTIHNVDCEVK